MINIIELEDRWLKYKIKSFIPHAIILVSIFLISISLYNFFIIQNNTEPVSVKITVPQQIQKNLEPHTFQEKVVPSKPIVRAQLQQPVKLTPSLDFMKKMQNSQQPQYRTEKVIVPIKTTKLIPKKNLVIEEESEILKPVLNSLKITKINIKRKNSQNDIFEIITRFKKNNNPALSLFVAKKYYEMQNYKQAYNYALITNSINRNIESSWLIFSKSLVKLNKKEKAIRTLKKYISQSHSNSAKILLDEILSGEFQ